jgi:hypothetical protein
MRIPAILTFLLSCLYFLVALAVAFIALFAPCGLAPGAWCDLEGPNWFGSLLGFLGPIGVIAVFIVVYFAIIAAASRLGHDR